MSMAHPCFRPLNLPRTCHPSPPNDIPPAQRTSKQVPAMLRLRLGILRSPPTAGRPSVSSRPRRRRCLLQPLLKLARPALVPAPRQAPKTFRTSPPRHNRPLRSDKNGSRKYRSHLASCLGRLCSARSGLNSCALSIRTLRASTQDLFAKALSGEVPSTYDLWLPIRLLTF